MKKLISAIVAAALTTVLMLPLGASAATGEIQATVNFRDRPSTSSDVIRKLTEGEHVTILEQVNKYWYKVHDSKGRQGYVSALDKFIDVSSGNSSSGNNDGSGSAPVSGSKGIEAVIAAGMEYLGTPYEFGSNRNTTTTFDCSDFVRQIYLEGMGIKLPTDSRKQGAYVKENSAIKRDWRDLKRGDLMFFMSYKGSTASAYRNVDKSTARITHVGLYLGDGRILQTYSKKSGGVRIDSIEGKQWEHRFLFGGSVAR